VPTQATPTPGAKLLTPKDHTLIMIDANIEPLLNLLPEA
jgi:hypothetical protein